MTCLLFSTLSSCLLLVRTVDLNLLIVFLQVFTRSIRGPLLRNSVLVDRSISNDRAEAE